MYVVVIVVCLFVQPAVLLQPFRHLAVLTVSTSVFLKMPVFTMHLVWELPAALWVL